MGGVNIGRVRTGQYGSVRVSMVLHGSGLVRMGVRKVRIAQVRSVHIRAAQDRSGKARTGQVSMG